MTHHNTSVQLLVISSNFYGKDFWNRYLDLETDDIVYHHKIQSPLLVPDLDYRPDLIIVDLYFVTQLDHQLGTEQYRSLRTRFSDVPTFLFAEEYYHPGKQNFTLSQHIKTSFSREAIDRINQLVLWLKSLPVKAPREAI